MDELIAAVPWLLPVVLVLLSLKVIGSLGARLQRGFAELRRQERDGREAQERATSSDRLQSGDAMPPIEPR